MSTKSDQVAAMRSRNRAEMVAALRDGRKLRASTVPSGKRYNRKDGKRVEY
jgi:hypothetical protein